MASGIAVSGLTDVNATALQPVLSTYEGPDGNEYVYLQGVASNAAGLWSTYDEGGLTTLTVANAVGKAAVAMAAILANQFGWYQIKGVKTGAGVISGGSAAADVALYLTATAGRLDDVDVAGDLVSGVLSRTAESSGTLTVQLNYPFVYNVALD